jgi:hypothetical protein
MTAFELPLFRRRTPQAACIVTDVFSVEDRDAARAFVLKMAADDPRVTAGAIVGSIARGSDDRWSDLDLTFAVADDVPIRDVIDDWTDTLGLALDATPLWDGQVGDRTYRVFLLPGALQVDLSFTPASQFGPAGPAFVLVFGEAKPMQPSPPPTAEHFFGWGAINVLHARRCIDRQRWWQAEEAIAQVRECALSLACLERGLDPKYGRGFDDLPADILAAAAATLVPSPETDRLTAALRASVELLLHQADLGESAGRIASELRAVVAGDAWPIPAQ